MNEEYQAHAEEVEAHQEAQGQTINELETALKHSRDEWSGITLRDIAWVIKKELGKDAEILAKELLKD